MWRKCDRLFRPALPFIAWSLGFYIAYFPWLKLGILFLIFFPKVYLFSTVLGFVFGVVSYPKNIQAFPLENFYGRTQIHVQKINSVIKKGVLTGTGCVPNGGRVFFKIPILPWTGIDQISEGSQIFGFARCRRIKSSLNPFSLSFSSQIKGVSHVCKFSNYSIVSKKRNSILAEFFEEKFSRIPNFFGTKDLLLAFILGRVNDLNPYLDKLFRSTGLYHLLVLSGYQLVILSLLTSKFISYLRYKFNLIGLKSLIVSKTLVISAMLGYSIFVGLDKPLLRALIFLSLVEARKFNDSINPLIWSAYLVCAFEPGAQFTLSFLLTFSALLGFCLAEPFSGFWYVLLSSVFASFFSSLIMFLYEFDVNGTWVIANILFSAPFSFISTALGALGLIEFIIFDTYSLWFIVSGATLILIKLLIFFENILYLPFFLAAFMSTTLIFYSIRFRLQSFLMRKIFRRQRRFFKHLRRKTHHQTAI